MKLPETNAAAVLVTFLLMTGCASHLKEPLTTGIHEPDIQRVVHRIKQLEVGMTKGEVHSILDPLPIETKAVWISGGSDWGEGHNTYLLKHDYGLWLLWDTSDDRSWKYRRAWLDHGNTNQIEIVPHKDGFPEMRVYDEQLRSETVRFDPKTFWPEFDNASGLQEKLEAYTEARVPHASTNGGIHAANHINEMSVFQRTFKSCLEETECINITAPASVFIDDRRSEVHIRGTRDQRLAVHHFLTRMKGSPKSLCRVGNAEK